jgi:hypothetical protein
MAHFCFQFIFAVGYYGLTFLYAAELAPPQVRTTVLKPMGVTPASRKLKAHTVAVEKALTIHNKYYIVFAVINAIIVPSVYLLFPETKGRSLEAFDRIFAQSQNIFDPPRVERLMRKALRASDPVNRRGSDSCGENKEYVKEEVKA